MIRFPADRILERRIRAGLISTICRATSKTMEAWLRSQAAPYTSALGSLSAYKKIKSDSCRQLAFPVLLWNLYISRQELPFPVFLDDAEEITHNLFLPRQEQERLPGPFAFGMTEMLDEGNRPVGLVLVVMGIWQHER